MSYVVDVESTVSLSETVTRAVGEAAFKTLLQQGTPQGTALTVLLTDDEYLRRLNRQYRAVDEVTDVLSFPAGEPLLGSGKSAIYLGDIAISIPTAERQAGERGHTTLAELQLLTVHGVLHLLGHDHAGPAEREMMWAAQADVMSLIGLADIVPSEGEHDA